MYRVMIKKELKSILYSKKILISIAFACLYMLILDIVAVLPFSTPIFNIGIGRMLKGFSLIGAFLCSEIIFYSMIDENRYKTWDIIKLSKISINKIILSKIFVPTTISITVIYISAFINNIGKKFVDELYYVPFLNLKYFFIIFFCSLGVQLFSMGRCANREEMFANTDYVSCVFNLLYVIVFWMEELIGVYTVLLSMLLTVIAYLYTLKKFVRMSDEKRKRLYYYRIKKEGKIEAFFAREMGRLLANKKGLIKLAGVFVCSPFIFNIPYKNIVKLILFMVLSFQILITIVLDINLESIFSEKKENMEDVLAVAGISKKINYLYSAKFSIIITGLVFVLMAILNIILFFMNKSVVGIWIVMVGFLITSIFSLIYTCLYTSRHFLDLKDVKLIRKNVTICSAVIYLLVCGILYCLKGGIIL